MIKHVTKENLKMVGNAGYRIGKDIVREGTKAVVIKAAGNVVGTMIADGFDGVKKMDLDSFIGDISRMEKKAKKRAKRAEKREARRARKAEKLDKLKKRTKDVGEIIDDVKEEIKDVVDDEKEVTE